MGDATEGGIPIGFLHSLTGTMAISEIPLRDAELLAAEEINRSGGVLGRPVIPLCADGRSRSADFASAAEELLDRGAAALFGCWTSASRKAVRRVLERRGGLLGYPAQYEGFEESPRILYGGSCLNQQVGPALDWLEENRSRNWFLVGSDYVFPRVANRMIRCRAGARDIRILGERYFPLGERDFRDVAEEIRRENPDAVICTLNGDGIPAFYGALRTARVAPEETVILAFSAAEPELREAGEAAVGTFACWGYVQSLNTRANRRFVASYRRRFGAGRACSDPIATAYSLVHLWSRAAGRAGTLDPARVRAAAIGRCLSGPLGRSRIFPNGHAARHALIGRMEGDGNFRLLRETERPIPPLPWLGLERSGLESRGLLQEALSSYPDILDRNSRLESEMARRHQAELVMERSRADLEEGVRERTAQLDEANRVLREEVRIRCRIQGELEQERDFSRAVIDGLPGVFSVYDEAGRVLRWNRSQMDLLGCGPERMSSMTLEDQVVPEDRERAARAFREILGGASDAGVELRFRDRDGLGRPHFCTGSVLLREGWTHVVEYGVDISALKRVEKHLRESEERFRGFFEQTAVGVCIMDLRGCFLQVNPAFCAMCGYAESELLGRSFSLLVFPEDAERERALARSLWVASSSSFMLERRYLRRDGSVAWGRIGTSLMRGLGGEPVGYIGTALDVTDRWEAHEALERLTRKLELKVKERTRELAEANERLRVLSERDELTGLANRRRFQTAMESEIRRLGRRRKPLGLLLCDVDFFKNYNDRYGHIQGDACLKAIGGVLSGAFGRAGELPARYGGEEFAVILPCAGPDAARAAGERLRRLVEELGMSHEASSAAATVTISVGAFSALTAPGRTPDWFVERADRALYRAKAEGRNRTVLCRDVFLSDSAN